MNLMTAHNTIHLNVKISIMHTLDDSHDKLN